MKLRLITESTVTLIKGGIPPNQPRELVNAPNKLFHGTSTASIRDLANGLPVGLHVTKNRNLANWSSRRAVHRFGGEPLVITIDTSELPDEFAEGSFADLTLTKPIPAEALIIKTPRAKGKPGEF